MLSTTNDDNESKYSLANGRILNFLNNSLQEALLLVPDIVLTISFSLNNFLLYIEFHPKIIPYYMMEWK